MIYFAREEGSELIKIGFSVNPTRRMPEIQKRFYLSTCPVVIGTDIGGRPEEKALHHQFRHLRIDEEWFRGTRELLNYVAALPPWLPIPKSFVQVKRPVRPTPNFDNMPACPTCGHRPDW